MAGYTPAITAIEVDTSYNSNVTEFGGWNPETKKISKLHFVKMMTSFNGGAALSPQFYAMDTVALAIEAGALNEKNFHELLSGADLDALCDELVELDMAWVNDRHFHALATVLGHFEEQLNTYPNIGVALRETFAG